MHVHRNLEPVRNDDGTRIAQICPGCTRLFDGVTGHPLVRGTGKWQRALEQMRDDLEAAEQAEQDSRPGLLRRLIGNTKGDG